MFESGEVKRAEGGRATVVMRPAGGCAGCNRCAGKNGRELIADNAIGAKAGDIVSVEISERSRLAAAVTVFLIPGSRRSRWGCFSAVSSPSCGCFCWA